MSKYNLLNLFSVVLNISDPNADDVVLHNQLKSIYIHKYYIIS